MERQGTAAFPTNAPYIVVVAKAEDEPPICYCTDLVNKGDVVVFDGQGYEVLSTATAPRFQEYLGMATPQLTQLAIVGACGAHQRP